MAHPLFWPGVYYFYPIGNTPAICLTRDLAPEEPANILLLGCGDPRNILYTIFCEPNAMKRKLDFTCCDVDPAILARNVLLLTIVADKHPNATAIWNVFYHMYLDDESHRVLVEQCKKLLDFSQSLQHWRASPYGPFIRMCTEFTLVELRRHWSLYACMHSLPHSRIAAICDAFSSKLAPQKSHIVLGTTRAAGPLIAKALPICAVQFERYWKTGVTFSDPERIIASKLVNPTFVYSLGGEGFSVQYVVDPLISFHYAAVLGNAKREIGVSDLVDAAQAQFKDWCTAFSSATSSLASSVPVVRCFLGEATAVCRTLRTFGETGTVSSSIPVSQFETQLIQLDEEEYNSRGAPSTFNVIDSSNLDDHIALLNVLIITVPLLASASPSSVLYTESLNYNGENATKDFAERLYADITTFGILLGLCPVDYLSGFTTRCNTHELLMYLKIADKPRQFHQVTTWKSPAAGDFLAVQSKQWCLPPAFEARQLGTLLYDMYHQLFEQEDANHFIERNQHNVRNAIANSNLVHYIRESFVLFLKLVRDRLRIPQGQWLDVMDQFRYIGNADQTLIMDTVHSWDFFTQLHRHGVHRFSFYDIVVPKIGRFSSWKVVPKIVRIVLVVPREKLAVLDEMKERIGTPLLRCDIRGPWSRGLRSHNVFSSVHAAFGRVISRGTESNPRVLFDKDPDGWKGTLPLVVSFTLAARYLTEFEPMETLDIYLSVRDTVASVVMLSDRLGMWLSLFNAKLMDKSHVYVLPEDFVPSEYCSTPPTVESPAPGHLAQIGSPCQMVVDLDEECEVVASLTCRICIEDKEVKRLFASERATPQVLQDVVYPFPIVGSQNKLRLARTSLYIEVVVPPCGPFQKPDGMKLNPFPVVRSADVLNLWSIHRLNLPLLPILDLKSPGIEKWLDSHLGTMFSKREHSVLKKKNEDDVLALVKNSLNSIFVRSTGMQNSPVRRVFALRDAATNEYDTLLFISEVRFDLHSHTLVWDGYVLPLTPELEADIRSIFSKLVKEETMSQMMTFKGELGAWKQLLPALVERCRTTWMHGVNCEYKSTGQIPRSVELHAVDPLCSCGRGKDTEGMSKVALWKDFAPYVTRVALSPLFAVSYLETVVRDPATHRCYICRGRGQPRLRACGRCKKVRYCSEMCQKRDWKSHKVRCKA